MLEEMGSSMGVLILAAMVLMVVAVVALFNHVRYALLPVIVVATGLILTFGVMGLTGIAISMVVIGAFPILIGIGIDYSIQIHSRLDEEARGSSLEDAVRTTITKTGPAVLVAMLIAWFVMTWLFARHIERRVAMELENEAIILLADLKLSPQQEPQVDEAPANPRFNLPSSGLYWQVSNAQGMQRSRSLWDESLPLPEPLPPPECLAHAQR